MWFGVAHTNIDCCALRNGNSLCARLYEKLNVLSLRYILSIFEGKFYGMRACMHIDAFTGDHVRLDLFSCL